MFKLEYEYDKDNLKIMIRTTKHNNKQLFKINIFLLLNTLHRLVMVDIETFYDIDALSVPYLKLT